MTGAHDLLVEIGAEELPPKALRKLSEAFAAEIVAELDAAGFAHGAPVPYATPRRLAVLVPGVPGTQPDRDVERRGPPLAHAFDDKGRTGRGPPSASRSRSGSKWIGSCDSKRGQARGSPTGSPRPARRSPRCCPECWSARLNACRRRGA